MSESLCKCGHYEPEHDGPLDDGPCLGNDLACPCMMFDAAPVPVDAAAVSRARDEAWREAVEAVRYSLTCDMLGEHLRPCENVECKTIHAVLSALLARMDGAK